MARQGIKTRDWLQSRLGEMEESNPSPSAGKIDQNSKILKEFSTRNVERVNQRENIYGDLSDALTDSIEQCRVASQPGEDPQATQGVKYETYMKNAKFKLLDYSIQGIIKSSPRGTAQIFNL